MGKMKTRRVSKLVRHYLSTLVLAGCGPDSSVSPTSTGQIDETTAQDITTSGAQTVSSGTTSSATTTVATTSGEATSASPTTGEPQSTGDVTTSGGESTSSDPTGDPVPPDSDGDGVKDPSDNCPNDGNPAQTDTDADGLGDACDDDDDGDGVPDDGDNCPLVDGAQDDLDSDGLGDVCDSDDDGDQVGDDDDNCPAVANPDQLNTDAPGDSFGDACDDDDDDDQIGDDDDNCPVESNPDQDDFDGDGIGDNCDLDYDGDGVEKPIDPQDWNPDCPGTLIPNKIYATTWETLYTIDADTYEVTEIGKGAAGQYDLAIDQHGVLYSRSINNWLKCVSPTTGTSWSWVISNGTSTTDGLALFPPGVVDPEGRTFAVTTTHTLVLGHVENFTFMNDLVNAYSADYKGAGDITYAGDLGTFAALVHESDFKTVIIARIDPTSGEVLEEIAALAGYSAEFALAAWDDRLIAFGIGGEILEILPGTKEVTFITDTNLLWKGAAAPFAP